MSFSAACILIQTVLCVVRRASVPSGVCHGGHRPRRHLPGDFSQWRCAAGCREEEHSQAAGWGVFLWEDLQAEWVSHFSLSLMCSSTKCVFLRSLFNFYFSHRDMACSVAGITSDANVLTNELRLIAQRWVSVSTAVLFAHFLISWHKQQ